MISNHNNSIYHNITLDKVLSNKENKEKYRKLLINKYHKPILEFSLNIPYEKKNSNLINFTFNNIASKIIYSLSPITIFLDIKYSDNGNTLFLVFNDHEKTIKKLFTTLENNTPIGRLLDIDIYDKNNKKLSRNTLRKCFLCDKPAFECARSNRHSKRDINKYINNLLYTNFKDTLSHNMTNALYDELYTTPKPGLVDLNNNGSHKDLNIKIFENSIKTISKYYNSVIDTTYQYVKKHNNNIKNISSDDYIILFNKLQKIGIKIEKDMFLTTKNVNTHKGAIYLSILIISALTILIHDDEKYDCKDCFLENVSKTIKKLSKDNFYKSIKKCLSTPKSHGEYVYKKFKTFGPREESFNGIPTIIKAVKYNMDNYNSIYNINNSNKKFDIYTNYLYPILLLYIIVNTNDTNLIHRGGIQGLMYAKKQCKNLLKSIRNISTKNCDNIIKKIKILDNDFIKHNLSPGGSADILSMTIFLCKTIPCFIYQGDI